jgi:hypothetical protein
MKAQLAHESQPAVAQLKEMAGGSHRHPEEMAEESWPERLLKISSSMASMSAASQPQLAKMWLSEI